VIGVLGRIVLQFTRFVYNGLTGEVDIYIDKAIMSPKRIEYFVKRVKVECV
jgi:hypothetical protein